jgi:hypothetical protein
MKQIHLECKPDEVLVKALGFPRKAIKHHNDKGRVCNTLEKHLNEVGMIDEDPRAPQPTYLASLLAVTSESKHNLRVLTDAARGHKVIIICPRLEEWIIQVAVGQQVDMDQFGLPNKASTLHKLITSRLDQFNRLVSHLLDQQAEPILHLQRLLNS